MRVPLSQRSSVLPTRAFSESILKCEPFILHSTQHFHLGSGKGLRRLGGRRHRAKQHRGYIGRKNSGILRVSAHILPAASRRDAARRAWENPSCYRDCTVRLGVTVRRSEWSQPGLTRMMTGIERVQELGLNTRQELGLVNGHRCGFKFTGSAGPRLRRPGPGPRADSGPSRHTMMLWHWRQVIIIGVVLQT
jgi:hypothetical protein